jgi:hypothetical protein
MHSCHDILRLCCSYGASHGAPIYGELTDASFLEFLSLLQHHGAGRCVHE